MVPLFYERLNDIPYLDSQEKNEVPVIDASLLFVLLFLREPKRFIDKNVGSLGWSGGGTHAGSHERVSPPSVLGYCPGTAIQM